MEKEIQLNYEQNKAIELEASNKLPALQKYMKKLGRQKQSEKIVNEILDEEKGKAITKQEEKENEELIYYNKLQKDYLKQDDETNEFYLLRMSIISLLAQKKRGEATEQIVNYIKKNQFIYTTKEDTKPEMWIYKEGVYKPQGESSIKEVCRTILKENYTNHLANEIISKIQADTFIESEIFFQNSYSEEIPLMNGILNIKTRELTEFNPKKIFFNKLPIKYNPQATCPNVEEHFKTILKREEDATVMFEIFGFFLYKEYFIEKAIMFVGDGRNGKGKTIELMKRFLGIDNCASVPLNVMNDLSSFRVWDLFGKMANLAGDVSSTALKETALLKQTVGRDLIGADRKNKTTVNFVNYAKHVFACNELPKVYDFSRGFWTKWILFEFPYTFVQEEIYNKLQDTKNYRKMNPFIIERLTTEIELSGLLNKALDGLKTILKNKDFSYSIGVDEIKKFWVRKSDSFTAFAMDHLEESDEGSITKQNLRKLFNKYCKKHKIKGASDRNIKVVLEEMYGATDRQLNDGIRVWEGVKLKESSEFSYLSGRLND